MPAYRDEVTAVLREKPPASPPRSQGPVTSATFLTITATFDPAFNAAETAAINQAIAFYQSTLTTPINVTISFTKTTSGFASNNTTLYGFDYMTFITALRASATSADDTLAISLLPVSTTNPVNGSTNIFVKTANIRALALPGGPFPPSSSGGFDGQVMINTSVMDVDDGTSPFSMVAATEHEIDEVLGLGSALPDLMPLDPLPEDLFRYASAANVRSFSTNASCTSPPRAFFSLDGTNAVDEFHNCTDGSDYGDWVTHTPSQVQDAVTNGSAKPSLTATSPETRGLDVIGYTLVTAAPNPPTLQVTPH